jgi:hypothetical protein
VPSRAVFRRKERVNHHAFAATALFKRAPSSQLAGRSFPVAAAKKKSTHEVSDEGFDLASGTGLPEYIATALLGILLGFLSSGVSLLTNSAVHTPPCSTAFF